MVSLHHRQRVEHVLTTAFEFSIYPAPKEPGLIYDKLVEIGQREGLQAGEIGDVLPLVAIHSFGRGKRLFPGRAERLSITRQRIHAGRRLSEFLRGVPDLRPDEACDGKLTVQLVGRSVQD